MLVKTGLGQDSHRFEARAGKPLLLGGVLFPGEPGLEGNSDSDVILHALVNALTGIHGMVVLGPRTDELCKSGVTDSKAYVKEALHPLNHAKVNHVSISLECARPKIGPQIPAIRHSVAELLGLATSHVTVTAHSGEGLTAFGKGEGILATVIVTAVEA